MVVVALAALARADGQEYARPTRVGLFSDSRLTEISGMVPVTGRPGLLWVHNDSDNSAHIFAVRDSGAVVARVAVTGASNVDWEDISCGPGPLPGRSYLYIADTGDNATSRDEVCIWRIPEPRLPDNAGGRNYSSAPAARIRVRYPDGNFNAEALFVHPERGDLYIISKTTATAHAYRLRAPAPVNSLTTLEALGNFRIPGEVTAADITGDGLRMVVRTFTVVREYDAPPGQPFERIFASAGRTLPNANSAEPKSEAACYDLDDRHIYTCNEIAPAVVHLTRRIVPQDFCAVPEGLEELVEFRRGDVYGPDDAVDMHDAVRLASSLVDDRSLVCQDAADVDDDGVLDEADVDALLESFARNVRPPDPFRLSDPDGTSDDLGCFYEIADAFFAQDALWSYWSSPEPPFEGWCDPDADVSAWPQGPGGIGFGTEGLGTEIDSLPGSRHALAARCEFEFEGVADHTLLVLQIDYDDGFVAYINGVEVGRRGLGDPGFELYDSQLARAHTGGDLEDVLLCAEPLVVGRNVLAIELRNRSTGTSPLYFRCVLRSGRAVEPESDPRPPSGPPATMRCAFDDGIFIGRDAVGTVVVDSETPIAAGSFLVDFNSSHLRPTSVTHGEDIADFEWFEWGIDTSTGLVSCVFLAATDVSARAALPSGDTIALASVRLDVRALTARETRVAFLRRTYPVRLENQLVGSGGEELTLETVDGVFAVEERIGPAIEAVINHRGVSGRTFTVIASGLDVSGVSVTVGDRDAEFSLEDADRLEVVAPPCATVGWSVLEVCTALGCDSIDEGFFYTEASAVWARGDANNDLRLDISDAVAMLGDLFLGDAATPACPPALDVNSDDRYDVSDPVFLLRFLFQQADLVEPPYTGLPALCP